MTNISESWWKNMLNVLGVLGFVRKMDWRGWILILIAGAMAFLWIRGNRYRGKYSDQLQINHQLEWDISLAEAKFDSLKGIGDYHEIRVDSVSQPYPVLGPGRTEYDTVYLESGEVGPDPIVISQVKIDTSKWFGPKGERFGVRVYGLFHWPQEFSYRNRLLIDPLGFEGIPLSPVERRSGGWRIGLTAAISSQQRLYGGLSVCFKSISLIGIKDMRRSDWLFGLEFKLLRF
jgi:hypothetical protein